jgi:hypothetical protein
MIGHSIGPVRDPNSLAGQCRKVIRKNPGITSAEIADIIGVEWSKLSGTVYYLLKRNHVRVTKSGPKASHARKLRWWPK